MQSYSFLFCQGIGHQAVERLGATPVKAGSWAKCLGAALTRNEGCYLQNGFIMV